MLLTHIQIAKDITFYQESNALKEALKSIIPIVVNIGIAFASFKIIGAATGSMNLLENGLKSLGRSTEMLGRYWKSIFGNLGKAVLQSSDDIAKGNGRIITAPLDDLWANTPKRQERY